ncbi:MAG: hypothetical protein WCV59_05485 [Parcubacteria group bacterium]|jgi:hypothetical protein
MKQYLTANVGCWVTIAIIGIVLFAIALWFFDKHTKEGPMSDPESPVALGCFAMAAYSWIAIYFLSAIAIHCTGVAEKYSIYVPPFSNLPK